MGSASSSETPSFSLAGVFFGQTLCAREYTRAVSFPPVAADLAGRRVVVTGGSAGLGLACVSRLAALGATVHVLCRDADRAEKALAPLRQGSGEIHVHKADVGVLADVQSVAGAIPAPVHGLVNNAGALATKRVLNADGVESHVACHVVGLHALTKALAPKLAPGAAVVNVASGGLYGAKLHVGALEDGFASIEKPDGAFDGALAYAVCKRAQLELTKIWAQRLPSAKVTCMHPGWAQSNGLDGLFELYPAYKGFLKNFRTPEQGADTMVWLCAKPEESKTGLFYFDRKVATEHRTFAGTQTKEGDAQRLWDFCEQKTAALGAAPA